MYVMVFERSRPVWALQIYNYDLKISNPSKLLVFKKPSWFIILDKAQHGDYRYIGLSYDGSVQA